MVATVGWPGLAEYHDWYAIAQSRCVCTHARVRPTAMVRFIYSSIRAATLLREVIYIGATRASVPMNTCGGGDGGGDGIAADRRTVCMWATRT